MNAKRVFRLVILVLSVALLSMSIGPLFADVAQAADQAVPAVPYTGHLTAPDGQPVADGEYDFRFEIYDGVVGGQPLWAETHRGLNVRAGGFVAPLGSVTSLPMTLDGKKLWLAISVRGPGEGTFTLLSPRQPLAETGADGTASPQAGPVCPHTHWGETWTGSGVAGLILQNPSLTHTVYVPGWLSAVLAVSETLGGVHGKSTQNIGVLGESSSGPGVYGKSATGQGGFFESGQDHYDLFLGGHVGRINTDPADQNSDLILSANNNVDVRLDNDGGEEALFTVWGSAYEACNIRENGNLKCFGTKSAVVETAEHGARQLYAMESPEVWFEDVGSAALTRGEATVAFESIFAETVNLSTDYHVYLTALCQEPVLLFVTAKTQAGFTVKGVNLDGKPSTCGFDYRVVAKRLGYEDVRLARDIDRREVGP
jgi:hypothetical protein